MVEKRFEKLGMPDIERFENYLPTAFNSELTLLQKVNKIIFDLIETNKLTNEMVDYLNQFIETFDEKLYETIEDVLAVWLEDGRLADIVRVAINDEVIEARTDYLGKKYVNLKERLDVEREEVILARGEATTLGERLDEEKAEVRTQLSEIAYNVNSFNGANDNEKIVNAFNFMNNLPTEGATLFFPSRETPYILTSSVISNGKWNLKMDKEIQYNGTGISITIKDASRRSIEIMIHKGTNYGGWFNGSDFSSVGVQFDNVNWCELHLKDVRGFHTNTLFDNSYMRGSCYNNVSIGLIYDGFINIYLKQRSVNGETTSWNNQNQFFGGAIKISGNYKPVIENSTLFLNEGNGNTLIGIAMEGNAFTYSIFTTASNNIYINCRFEQNLVGSLAFKGVSCLFNQLIGGYSDSNIISKDKPSAVTSYFNSKLSDLNSSHTYPQPMISGHNDGNATNSFFEFSHNFGGVRKKILSASGDGKFHLYNSSSLASENETVVLDGGVSSIKLGYGGSFNPKDVLILDPNTVTNLVKIPNYNVEIEKATAYKIKEIEIISETIDIGNASLLKLTNTADSTLKYFTGGREGQVIYLYVDSDFITISNSSLIKLKNGLSRKINQYEVVSFLRLGGRLVEA